MQQKLTNQLKVIQNSDDSMKTPLPTSLAVSLVSGICPSTTPVRNKRLPLTKEIKKKKKDIRNNNSSNSSSISSGNVIAIESSMSAGKKTLTIEDLLKCPGCHGYFEKSVFLTHSFSCSSNIGLDHSHNISKSSLVAKKNPLVVVTTAEEQTSVNSLSLSSATNIPSPISISDSADEDDDDDDSCIVIETENDVLARNEDPTESTIPVIPNRDSVSSLGRSGDRLHVINHNELTMQTTTSSCNVIAEELKNDNVSAWKSPCGGTAVPRGHYKKPSRPCPFCGVMQAKLTRHIQLKHKDEEQVKEALSLPPQLQRNAFNEMKKEGIRRENLRRLHQLSENVTDLIKERSCLPTTTHIRCPNCNECFPHNVLPQHLQNCSNLAEMDEVSTYDFSSKDRDVYPPVFIETGNNQLHSCLPTAVMKVENDATDVSCGMVDTSSMSDRGILEKTLPAVIQGSSLYKETCPSAEALISIDNRIEASSNGIGLQKSDKNVPDVCMHDILQIQADPSVVPVEKLSVEHSKDTVTLNFRNSGRKVNSCKESGSVIQAENALDLNIQYRDHSLPMENLQNSKLLNRQRDIRFASGSKETNGFVSSSLPHFEENSACLERDMPKQDSFPFGNEVLLFEERNQLSLLDDREELPYLAARHVFADGQPGRKGSHSAHVLEDANEERTHKSKIYKKPFRPCPFCGIMQAKLTRHIKLKHKNEERVKEALKLSAQEQRFAFNEFKREGIMLENLQRINTTPESDCLIYDGGPHSRVTMTICPYCKGSYTKDVIWEHVRSCQLAPPQMNVSSWLLHQETDVSDLDLIQNLPEKVSDKQVNPNLVMSPVSPLASSSSSLSISKREGRLPSFSDIEEKLVYGCGKELGLPSIPFKSDTEKNETLHMRKAPVAGSEKLCSERISFPCSQEMATSYIKEEPLASSSPYSQVLIEDTQSNFRRLLQENNPDCCLHLNQKAELEPSQMSTKPVHLASNAEHVAQIVGVESQKCSQTLDFLPFFTKIESDESSEPQAFQENPAVEICKRIDGLRNKSPEIEDFSLVSIKKEVSVTADPEAPLVHVLDMRAESPTVSISDPSDEDCSILSSGSSVFVPLSSDQPASHTNSQVLGMKTSDKTAIGKPQTYKKPSRPCLFCGIMQAKLSRHIKLKHKDEKRVQEAMQLPQPMQRHVFNQFKKEGIERENLRRLNNQTQSKDLILMRTTKPNSSFWMICINCKVSVRRDAMKEHMDSCSTVLSNFSSSNCLSEQETPAMSRSVTLPNTGQVLTGGSSMFLQSPSSRDSTLVSGNIDDVFSSLSRPPPNLEVKKENVDLDGFENQDEPHIQTGMESKKADGVRMLNQPAGPMLFESDFELKYCPPKNVNALNNGQKQQPFSLESEVNPTSMQIMYTPFCEPQNERQLLKGSSTKDAVRELYDLPASKSDFQTTDVGLIKQETEDIRTCSAQSSLIFISDSSDDETIEDTCSQYETTALPSIASDLAKNPGCTENNTTGKNNGGRSYKKPFRPCPFCGIMQAKLTRHIQLKHKDEPRVRSALSLPQPFQRQAFNQFKKEGIMKENMRRITNPHDNEGLISERLPPEKMLNVSCCGCGGMYSRDFISKHVLGCPLAVANLGLSTASTMMVFEDSCRPHMVNFKSNRDLDLRKEWVLKMRQASSVELKDNETSSEVYMDQEKVLKDLREKREKVEMSIKTNNKNGFMADSFKMSLAIEKTFVKLSSIPSEHVERPDCLAGVQDNPKKTNSCIIPFVNSKLLDENDLILKSDKDFTVVNQINQKNLPDIIPSEQNTVNMSPPLKEIDLTADISVSKIRQPALRRWGFSRGGIQKAKSYKRPFRPCPFCGMMQAKLIRHIKLRHKKERPVRAVLQLSPPLQLKAFHHFKNEGSLQHNGKKTEPVCVENSQNVSERHHPKKLVGGIRPRRFLPKASRCKSYRKYFSKTSLYHNSEYCHKSKTETDYESYNREDPVFINKILRLASSLVRTDPKLLENGKSSVLSEKRLSTKQQNDGCIIESPLVKLRLPDVTSHTEKRESKSREEEIKRQNIVQFVSIQEGDDCTSNNQGTDPADLVKADSSAEKTPRRPMLPVKTEKVSFLEKGENLNINPQSLPTLTAPLTNNPQNPNPDCDHMAPNTDQSINTPQFPLKACGSSVLSDTENGYCLPSISVLGVAPMISTNQTVKKRDASLNSTAACLETDGKPCPTQSKEARPLVVHENASFSTKQQKNVEKFSLREGPSSYRAESECWKEEKDYHAEISATGLNNGNRIETLKIVQGTSDNSQTEEVEVTASASSIEGMCSIYVGTELPHTTDRGAQQASLHPELESTINDSQLEKPSTFTTSQETLCPAKLIKMEISLPSSPVLACTVTKGQSEESVPIFPLQDISKETSDIEQELGTCEGELLNSNKDQHLFSQMHQFEGERDDVAEIVCFETDKTKIPAEQATMSLLDSVTDKKDYTTDSKNPLKHLDDENPAEKSRQSYDFCEGANKNGRSASGGNNGGGGGSSGGGGGGSSGSGGGQMSSAQNSSRDSGSSTTSGRNGTGSCSFGRGGSTNRKPPTPCPFCGVRQAKLKRHIQLRHKDEERVKKALQLPPNLQRDVFHQFKEEGLANERNRVKDNSGATVSSRGGSGNRSSGSSSSSTATSSGISGGGGSSVSCGGSSSSGRGTPTAGNIGSSAVGGTTVRCSSTGSNRGGIETSKVECTGSGANIMVPHDPSALKVLCPLCDTYYEKDVLQMHMIGCSSALSHFNASDWLTGPVPLGASDSELDADFLSERSSDLVLDPNQLSLTTPLIKEEYEPPVASCSVSSLSSYKDFSGYMVTQPQQQIPRQQQQQQQQQQPQHSHHQQHPGQNYPASGNSFIPNLEECQQMPPNYGMEMGQNQGTGNTTTVTNPYTVPAYPGSGISHENSGMVSAASWNQRLSEQRYQQQMYHQQQQQQLLQTQHPHPHQQQPHLHRHQQQQQQQQQQHHQPQQPPPPTQQHLQPPHHTQQHLQSAPALSQQTPPQTHHQRPMPADPTIMYMKNPKQEFPQSSSSFHTPDNFMLPSPQMGSQMPDPSLHHRPPQLYSPNSGHGKRASSTASPHDYGAPMFNSPTHPQMSPSGGPGYHYASHHQVPTMPLPSPSPRSCGNFPHMDDGGYQQMMSQHCMPDQGMMRSPPVAPHLPPPPPNRHAMMQMDATQPHGNIPMGSGDNNNNNNNRSTGSPYLATRQIATGGNTTGSMAPNAANNYRSPMYHSIGPGTVSSSPNSSFHHSPVASPSLSSTSSSSSKNSVTYHYPTSTAVSSTAPGSSFSGPMYGLPDLSSSSSIGDNCRLSYESMGHSSDGIGLSQHGHQLHPLQPQQLPPPPPQQQSSLLPLQPLPSLMDNPSPASLLPSMPQMTPPRNHSASMTPAASGGSMSHLPFAGGSGGSSSSSNQIDPNCIIGGSCDPTCGDGDRFSHQAGNMSSLHEGGSKDLADEISAAIDSHEDSSCGSSTTSGSGLSTAAGGAEWNSCSGSTCPSGTGNNGSTPALFTATTLDSNNASNSSGSSSCGGNSPRGYSKLRNYKKPARPCPFCGVMQAKLTRHIKLKHKEDKRVVEALGLPQPLKRQAFSQFKKEGIMKQARTSSGGPTSSSADPPSS